MSKTKIAIIDDRKDARAILASTIQDALVNLSIQDNWAVLQIAPLLKLATYPDWINRENVGVLLVDERLNEIPNRSGKAAAYSGSDLVALLRKQFKDMPIYGVTSYPDDTSLQDRFALFDEVVKRDDFTAKAHLYVDRFLRTYKTFLDAHEQELAELTSLSEKIALGNATSAEKKRAGAIQTTLEIPITTSEIGSRKDWLEAYQKVIEDFKQTQDEATRFLKKKVYKKKK